MVVRRWVSYFALFSLLLTAGCSESSKPIIPEACMPSDVECDSIVKLQHYQKQTNPNLPKKFAYVNGSNHVYRTGQPRISQLKYILENYDIDVVIRMNDTEGTGVTVDAERKLVESMGKKFVFVNAHLGYEPGKGYTKSLDTIQPYLKEGNSLIHCTAGMDRTGYMIGKYLLDNSEFTREQIYEYTASFNYWDKNICDGKHGYIKYMEAFYSYDDWCKNYGKNCTSCL